jgi:hypothetical protein
MAQRQVTVAGDLYTIEKFSTRKVAVALRKVGKLGEEWQALAEKIDQVREKYAKEHPVRTTRDQVGVTIAELKTTAAAAEGRATELRQEDKQDEAREMDERAADISAAADYWQRLLDGPMKDKDAIEQPGEAPGDRVFLAVASDALAEAEDKIAGLVGLALMTNAEVASARKAGTVDEVATGKGNDVLDKADPDDVLDLLSAAGEMLLGDVASRRDRLGKLGALFRSEEAEEGESQETEITPTVTSVTVPDDSTLTTGKPTSPTSSPEPTDGSPTSDLTESITDSPSASSTAST